MFISNLIKVKQFNLKNFLYSTQLSKNLINLENLKSSFYPYFISKLKNGIKISTIEIPNSKITNIGIYINSGSKNEKKNQSGTAHFLEHILFKGTKNIPKNKFEYIIEQNGSNLNAYTSREHTLYSIEFFPKNLKQSLNILSEMIQNPLITKKSIDEEKETIKAELLNFFSQSALENPFDLINEFGHCISFGFDSLMGRPILGNFDNINNVNRDMVFDYYNNNYYGDNLIIIGSGNIKHDNFVNLVNEFFGNFKKKNLDKSILNNNINENKFYSDKLYIHLNQTPLLGIGIFFNAPNWNNKDYFNFVLLERLFGQYNGIENNILNSRNNNNALEFIFSKYPNILKFKSFYNPYKENGIFGMLFLSNGMLINGCENLINFILKVYSKEISEIEIERAKNKFINDLLNIQTPNEYLQLIGTQMLYFNKIISKYDFAKKICEITSKDLSNCIKKYFLDKKPSIVYYGPTNFLFPQNSYYSNEIKKRFLNGLNKKI